jgi:hypothetical protein
MKETTENENPSDREKLLKELKERLREIEELKRALDIYPQKEEEKEPNRGENEKENHPLTSGQVRDAVEELIVPPLELLQDQPPLKKQKKIEETEAT